MSKDVNEVVGKERSENDALLRRIAKLNRNEYELAVQTGGEGYVTLSAYESDGYDNYTHGDEALIVTYQLPPEYTGQRS